MELPDKMMQERIENFNQKILNKDLSQFPIGLHNGKMGLCIYFYELADLTSEKKYRIIANRMLNDIVNRVNDNIGIGSSSGLTGICMAINFLLDTGYIEGNPNRVLKNYDDKIIKTLLFDHVIDSKPNLDMIRPIIESTAYLTIRLQHTGLSNNERSIMQGVIINIINKIELLIIDKFSEPALFSITEYLTPFYLQLLLRIYQLNFYNCKIEKIVEGLSPHILYSHPLNKANRFSLCTTMKETCAAIGDIPGWDKHINLLQQDLDKYQVISEFKNRDMVFNDGLCGFYYLLRKTGIDKNYNDLLINRITNIEDWDHFFYYDDGFNRPFSLFNGIPGIILTYLHILYKSNSMAFFDQVVRLYV